MLLKNVPHLTIVDSERLDVSRILAWNDSDVSYLFHCVYKRYV